MVLQRSKLPARRTVMMLTIRSRNRDNGGAGRGGGGWLECLYTGALADRCMRNYLGGRYSSFGSEEISHRGSGKS